MPFWDEINRLISPSVRSAAPAADPKLAVPAAAAAAGGASAIGSDEAEAANLRLGKKGLDTARSALRNSTGFKLSPLNMENFDFSYDIFDPKGKNVGSVYGNINGNVAEIEWLGSEAKLTRDVQLDLREQFRKDFPGVDTFQGLRISGAKSQGMKDAREKLYKGELTDEEFSKQMREARIRAIQTIKIPALAAAIGVPLMSEDADAANARHFLGKWGLTDNIHPLGKIDVRDPRNLPDRPERASYYQRTGVRNLFHYEIKHEGKDVGTLEGFIRVDPKNPDAPPTAHIMWVGDRKAMRNYSRQAMREGVPPPKMEGSGAVHPRVMAEVLRKLVSDYPDIGAVEGHRLSGSSAGETVRFEISDKIKKGSGAVAVGAFGLPTDEAEAASVGSAVADAAMLPVDVASVILTGMDAEEAVGTAKDLIKAGADMVSRFRRGGPDGLPQEQQVAEALTPESTPPEGVTQIVEEPPEQLERVTSNPEGPQGFIGKLKGRITGSDIGRDDPAFYSRTSGIIAGGLTGAHIGSQVPGPPHVKAGATALFSVAGVTVGAAFPELTMEAAEKMGIVGPNYREKHGLSDDELRTLMEGEILLDLATGGLITTGQAIGRGISRIFNSSTPKSRKFADEAFREGIALMPITVGDRSWGRGFTQVFGRFPILGTPAKKRGQESAMQLQRAYENVPARLGPVASLSEIHTKVLSEVSGTVERINAEFLPRFDELLSMPGVQVNLVNTSNAVLDMVDDIGALIPSKSPSTAKGTNVAMPGRVKQLKEILDGTLKPVVGEGQTVPQTLKQVDSLVGVIEDRMAFFAKKGDVEAYNILGRVKNALLMDMSGNLSGPNAKLAQERLTQLNIEYSSAVGEIFNNAVAKKLGITPAEGFRALRFTGNQQKVVETVSRVLATDDPGLVTDLSKLLTPETFREMTAAIFKTRMDEAFIRNPETGKAVLHPGKFAKAFGLDVPGSAKYKQTEELLKHSGGGLTMEHLMKLDSIAQAIERTPIPDLSMFVARRASLQGLRGAIEAIVPTMMISGGTAGAAASGGSPAVGALVAAIGLRAISSIITNPNNARAFRLVLDETAKTTVRWAAGERLGRMAAQALYDAGELDEDQKAAFLGVWNTVIDAFRNSEERNSGN